jgi:hypothetical protein
MYSRWDEVAYREIIRRFYSEEFAGIVPISKDAEN